MGLSSKINKNVTERIGEDIVAGFDDMGDNALGKGAQQQQYQQSQDAEQQVEKQSRQERRQAIHDIETKSNQTRYQSEMNIARFGAAGRSPFADDMVPNTPTDDFDGPDF